MRRSMEQRDKCNLQMYRQWGMVVERSADKIRLMVQIATLYYRNGLTQEQIGKELGITRLRVNKLLREAKQAGIVQIRIVNPLESHAHLRESLIKRYGLKDAEISLEADDTSPRFAPELGRAGAAAVTRLLGDVRTVGIGWGTAVYECVHALQNDSKNGSSPLVVPLIGGLGDTSAHFQINWLASRFAERIGGEVRPLHAPYLVERPEIKEAILSDQVLAETVALWDHLDMAVVGVGVSLTRSPLLNSPYFTPRHLVELQRQKIEGDICSRFFDAQGRLCRWDINERLIAVTLEQIRACPLVVAIAGGGGKFAAIQAALKAGYIDVLVTDSITAERLCQV